MGCSESCQTLVDQYNLARGIEASVVGQVEAIAAELSKAPEVTSIPLGLADQYDQLQALQQQSEAISPVRAIEKIVLRREPKELCFSCPLRRLQQEIKERRQNK